MKKIFIAISVSLLFTACLKDKGNYTYTSLEKITVTGIDPNYTKVTAVDHLTISPTVSSNKEGDFSYMWGIYESNGQLDAAKLDTLGHTKTLDYLVTQPAKGWVLVFQATNNKTGFSTYVTSNINVVTAFTRGWYVEKNDGTMTDLDLFVTPDTIVPTEKAENVFSLVNKRQLSGKGEIMQFYSDYKTDILNPGWYSNTRTLMVVSDHDAAAIDINSMKEIHGFDGLFFQAPAVKSPNFICNGSAALYFSNDGQLSSIYGMSPNSGQFGGAKLKDEMATPYHLSKYFLTSSSGNPIVYDELSSSFLLADPTGTSFSALNDLPASTLSATNTNKKLLYMGTTKDSPLTGYALMQDKTDASIKILAKVVPPFNTSNIELIGDTLSPGAKLALATQYALNTDENILYFVTDNQVWSYNIANHFEQLQFAPPSGEEITFLRHRNYTEINRSAYNYNYIMVGTKSSGNYKVRMFTKSSGNLSATPAFVLEGAGEVNDVMYISPSVSSYTYLNTY